MRTFKCVFATLLLSFSVVSSVSGDTQKMDSLKWVLDQEALNWPAEKLAPLFCELGKAQIELKDYQQALVVLERGIQLAEANELSEELSALNLAKGMAHYYLERYPLAIPILESCLQEKRKKNNAIAARAHHYLSLIYQINGSFDQAYKHATDGLLLVETLRDSVGMASAMIEIGHIHYAQENFQLALSRYESALSILENSPDEKILLAAYGALASVHKKLNRKDKSLHYNRKALALAEKYDYLPGIAEGKANNADLYIDLGLYELAADEYKGALFLFDALDEKMGIVESQIGLGNALVKAGEFEEALDYLDQADCLTQQLDAKKQQSLVYKYLAEANAGLGYPQYGYNYLNKYTSLKDSLLNEFSWKEMGEVKNKYELASRENEIALLKAEKHLLANEQKIKTLYWVLLLIFVVFFSGLGFVLYSKGKMQTRLLSLLEHRGQKIKAQNDKLAQSNLDLQHFASVASHDLREPLRMINSYTKLLNKRYGNSFDSSAKEFMGFVMDAATRMDKMLVDLLDYSRAEKKGERDQWVESVDVVETALANLKYKINQKGAEVNYLKSHLPQLYTNKTAMVQLFQNLISNAVKFSDVETPEVVVDCVKRGPYYCFAIKDNGIGIKKEKQSKIFEMFTRLHTREQYEGTGIGLATCKKIVDRQGGEIWVESVEGQGSTFYFTIPQDVSSN